ncbi:RteC domain-containing protein [Myroides ceti]|uniref:RteC domain-containing protein n=1 Tax=Paenimyroides ceti TaxID=395087 RepID=A0ABT8CWY5_9FLAO|nr:RteC domain-containing protein [Paenimyroides ceti]MDN3709053.1 RteC domain-containing protein [Paenimyroides ceti]
MSRPYPVIIKKLENEIKEVSLELDGSIALYEVIIELILSILSEIKEYILKNGFESIDGEIHFFKYQKPVIVAKLIYYNAIYKIETKKPYGEKQVKKYLNKEQKKLKKFFDNNIDFYKYYRSGNSFLDENFFVRGKHDIRLWLDTFYFEADHRFCTSHDYKVAKIIANDLIQVYLEDQLNSNQEKAFDNSSLNWTGSKTALTELIYALNSHGVFNNGNADIRLIAKTFESTLNIDLGDFYHTFMELKSRKINQTKFLDSLRDALIKKMDEQDER